MSDPPSARLRLQSVLTGTLLIFLVVPPAAAEEDAKRDRQQIGEVLGKPVYRDQIRTGKDVRLRDELLRLFAAPVMEKYREKYKADLEPTREEIDVATAYFDRAYRENMEDDEATLRRKLEAVEKQIAEPGLTAEKRRELERQRRVLRVQLKLPGRDFAIFMLKNWKFQRHLYEEFCGGRVLWQQAGMEAFDAMHKWLQDREKRGEFKIADPKLRASFYEYWTTMDHGPFLIEDKERIVPNSSSRSGRQSQPMRHGIAETPFERRHDLPTAGGDLLDSPADAGGRGVAAQRWNVILSREGELDG